MVAPVSNAAAPASNIVNGVDQVQLKKAAQAFEAIVLRQMIGSMRQASVTDDKDDVFGSDAADQFRDMGDANLAENMSKSGGFGITEMLLKQFNYKGDAPAAVDPGK
jgi:peptidoglycan hydrolase FlgJ